MTAVVSEQQPCAACGQAQLTVRATQVVCDRCGASGPKLEPGCGQPAVVEAWNRSPPVLAGSRRTIRQEGDAARRAPQAVTPHVAGERDPLELLARLTGVSSYRVPVEGRSSRPTLGTNDVAAALGFMRSPLERAVAEAVATQQCCGPAMERVVDAAEAEVRRSVQALRPVPLETGKGTAGAEILRRIIRDAAVKVVQPYAEQTSTATLARAAKVRKATYLAVHRCSVSVLQEALSGARRSFQRALWGAELKG
ncbi:hypothetical protein V3391_06605 [Luteimonas sp. SMYT11W]|uniref:TFIIB-type zinc ribbon-containing protein n=1 Tax=Luteimonas flava TaxID=3115822 RepID=A0ABU7WD24_9GAMM